ncbi:autotransporter domain-containing protein [Sphingomonas sp. AOB5]|uniref:autotransporter domain-containing protein n=1 Tax=Sphingomonas sp. AOB5 TaxID=3034017 RepID=UPI0023F7C5FC|nr:autotransporter domain-containing protein [Sphingomonas sp. AOB5]MDF7774915.1 autotransporter domain-containing protein [Sphingomonas sp. AOB5]
MKHTRTSRTLRASLLASAGLCLTALAAGAHAQSSDTSGEINRPSDDEAVLERQTTGPTLVSALEYTAPDPQIVIGAPGTPTTARDPVNVTGVGQMIVDQQNGFIGLCTGTLINARTVIFAAHCVNDDPANSYGSNTGGKPIGFGFSSNNNQAGASAFGGWLGNHQTNTSRYMYNVNQVAYHPGSLEPNASGFLYADVAIASLDTPAVNIPTWALLFSQLPQTTGGAGGTGYHVNIVGYGNNGTGATGSTGGIDYRRRLAENMLGALASIDDFEGFLFGGASGVLPQNLYWIDFDDPRRGTASADPRDFNAWRDNPTPNEGITASGDSGGPLILDRIGNQTLAKQLVIGVLSGGYTRFFNGAPANGYGTAAFYQPLYLYWDWIAANNPYRYVSSLAGDANWTDASHWVTNLDPNYTIIGPNGTFINGVPTNPGTAQNEAPGDKTFGEACFESGGFYDCQNMATGAITSGTRPIGQSLEGGGAATVSISTLEDSSGTASSHVFSIEDVDATAPTAQANESVGTNALPAATLANGLPGATNFVPNNTDGNRANGVMGKYFDVTLAATGTTTLSSAVTIDRFAIAGGGAALNITSTGSLTSLIDITQATGTMQVNGSLTSSGDYLMMSGGLNGSGTITVPYFTSLAGTIAPGTAGTTGTLTFRGNVVLSSGNKFLVDLGANGVSDRIAVQAFGGNTGVASIGGQVSFGLLPTARAGNSYTIMTAAGGGLAGLDSSHRFTVNPITSSAILKPNLTYSNNAVTVQLVASSYFSAVDNTNAVQNRYALLLDRNRSQAAAFDAIYGPLDLQTAGVIRTTLSGLAPAADSTAQSLGIVGVDNMAGFLRTRVDGIEAGSAGGTIARYGAVTQVAQNLTATRGIAGLSGMGFGMDIRSDAVTPMIQENALPENMSAFFAGGYLKGDSAPMTGITGRDDYDGWYAAAGIETSMSDATLGFALSYTRLDGTSALVGNSAKGTLYQGSIYGKGDLGGGVNLDVIFSAGALSTDTTRVVSFVGTPYTLRSSQSSLVLSSELGLGYDFDLGAARLTPRIAGRTTHIGFSREIETGGPMALMTDRSPVNSAQARGGLTIAGTGPKIRPYISGTVVHDFTDRPAVIGANFVGGVGGNVLFALNGQDHDWFELNGGLTISAGSFDLSISAETTLEREDVKSQAYRGSISFKF